MIDIYLLLFFLNRRRNESKEAAATAAATRKSNGRRRRFNLPMMNDRNDVESTGYTTDDAALENLSLYNDAGLTDAEGATSLR